MGLVRLLLAISVLITHSGPIFGVTLLSGDQAVTCFYVVSGFLMMLILNESYPDRRAFYVNRLLRIFPAFLAAVVLNLILLNWLTSPAYNATATITQMAQTGSIGGLLYTAVANLLLIGGELGRYLAFNPDTGVTSIFQSAGSARQANHYPFQTLLIVPQAWTLSIELQFYAIVPLLMRWREATLGLVATASLFVVMSLVEYLARQNVDLDGSAVSLFQFPYFILGMCGYGAYRHFRDSGLSDRVKRGIGMAALAGLLLLIAWAYAGERAAMLHFSTTYALFALCVPFAFHLTKDSTLDAKIGELSYPVYLFHFGISMAMRNYAGVNGAWGEYTLLATLVFSYLYVQVVDKRIQRVRRRIADRQRVAPPAQAGAALVAAGVTR